jgi:uncharacterized membrane protein (DUF106 family)
VVDTFNWLLIEFLNPAVAWFYPFCDWILLWLTKLGGIGGIVVVGIITGVGVNIFQKFFSNQKLLGKCKADLDKLKVIIAAAKKAGDEDRLARAMRVSGRVSGKSVWASIKPALWTVPPVVVIAMWAGSRLGFVPIKPGQDIRVTACFENEARGHVTLIAPEGVEVVGGPVAPIVKYAENDKEKKEREAQAARANAANNKWGIFSLWKPWTWFNPQPLPERGMEAHWVIRAKQAGDYKLQFRYPTEDGYAVENIDFPVHDGPGRPPEAFNLLVFDTPTLDHMQVLQFDIPESMPVAWWNLWFTWMGLYCLVAVGCGVAFRYILRVN